MQARASSADAGASVLTESVEYPAMTQADLEQAIQRSDQMLGDDGAIQWTAKGQEDNPDDEGYSSPTSSGHQYPEVGDTSGGEESPDWCTDLIMEDLFQHLSDLDRLSASSGSDGHSDSDLDAATLFRNMDSITQERGILDQTVPEEDIQTLFPPLYNITYKDIETVLSDQFVITPIDTCQKENPVTDTSIPEFDVLLNQESERFGKHVTKEDNECQQAKTVNHYVEDMLEEEEEEEEEVEEDEDYDSKDEDYIPPGTKKYHSSKNSQRTSHREHSKQIYSQLPSSKRSRRHSPQLWVFLLNCLCDPKLNPSVITWEDNKKGIFKLKNSKKVAELWGRRIAKEQKKPMDYEKFSRAIRYYYHKQVIISHPKRLTYQFGPYAKGWQEKLHGAAK